MPSGKHKSRTLRRVFVKTPGGNNNLHYRRRKPSRASCAGCGVGLQAVPRELPSKMTNMPKTAKRPQRPFGGVLCSICSRMLIKEKARMENE